jgi:hypothetical protein
MLVARHSARGTLMHYRNERHRVLHETLCAEAQKREGREATVWIAAEREALFGAVNRFRALDGKAPVTVDRIERVEQTALGHVDYGTKIALYCAEIVEEK